MKKFVISALVWAPLAFPVSMNFTGNFRSEATSYTNLGQTAGKESKQFIQARALLEPNLLIDDHFSVRSQWNLLTSPNFTPDATQQLGQGQGGYIFGDPQTSSLVLNRAWLEWTSDFGVVRVGRMPVSWGYGLIWDAGSRMWDDYQTTFDRLEYRLHLGNVIGTLAYSKARKLSVLESSNDQEFYTAYLQYDSAEMDVEGGIYFEKQTRSDGQRTDYTTATSANPFNLPSGYPTKYPLATSTPHPQNNTVLDVYLRKTSGYFTFGGELGWLSGSAFDYNGNGNEDSLNALGAIANVTFEYHSVKTFVEFLYAAGDSGLNDRLQGFVLLHPNRARPGLILGRELMGNYAGNLVGYGNLLAYSSPGSFSGVYYIRPGFRVDWSPAWASGVEAIIARKAATVPGEDASLGFELDVGTDYSVYKNFDLGLNLGFGFPGKGVATPTGDTKMIFALRTTAALKF